MSKLPASALINSHSQSLIEQIMRQCNIVDPQRRNGLATFWKYMFLLFETPRPSAKEHLIRDKLIDKVAKPLGLEYNVDDAGNLLIRKPATKGCEDKARIAIQAHLDMVCTASGGNFDFETTPISVFISEDEKWVQARGTTLGADDGVGVAAGLAMLEDDTTPHGPFECIFTVEEETTMAGAINLAPAPFLQAQAVLNVDSEEDHKVCVGCAGGAETKLFLPVTRLDAATYDAVNSSSGSVVTLNIHGLVGGHTGIDIHRGRANAIQAIARILREAAQSAVGEDLDAIRLISCTNAANAPNAIPSYAKAVVLIKNDAVFQGHFEHDGKLKRAQTEAKDEAKLTTGYEGFAHVIKSYFASYKAECKVAEDAGRSPDSEVQEMSLDVTLESPEETLNNTEWRSKHIPITGQCTEKFCALIGAVPHGVLRYSPTVEGAVETSNSLSVVHLAPSYSPATTEETVAPIGRHGHCPEEGPQTDCGVLHCFYRSFSDYQLREFGLRLKGIAKLAGAYSTSPFCYFSGWEPVMESKLLTSVMKAHGTLFPEHATPEVYSVHAGLECGPIKQQYPNLHIVSIGPHIKGAHSPDEKLEIATVEPYYAWVRETIAEMSQISADEF